MKSEATSFTPSVHARMLPLREQIESLLAQEQEARQVQRWIRDMNTWRCILGRELLYLSDDADATVRAYQMDALQAIKLYRETFPRNYERDYRRLVAEEEYLLIAENYFLERRSDLH